MVSKKPQFLDLFAGAGGLSEGFVSAGFEAVAHVEMERDACDTIITRMIYHALAELGKLSDYNRYLSEELERKDLIEKFGLQHIADSVFCATIGGKNVTQIINNIKEKNPGVSVDVIVGGPPCQAYSNIGRARDKRNMRWDRRKFLFRYYVDFLKAFQPKFFVFENVPGLLNSGGGLYLRLMTDAMKGAGYQTHYEILNASEFGVPQNRKRVICVGWRNDIKKGGYPDFKKVQRGYTVFDFLYDLPALQAGQGEKILPFESHSKVLKELGIVNRKVPLLLDHVARAHTKQDLNIYQRAVAAKNRGFNIKYNELPSNLKTHKKQNIFLDRFKVIDAKSEASHTVVAHIAKDGHYYIHPDAGQNRSLTVREAARLQTFPDDYKFEGSRTSQYKQIGNAVPPMLARTIGEAIHKAIVSHHESD